MKRLKKKVIAVLAALISLSLPQLATADGDAERGKSLATTCLGCHGIDSYRNAYPSYRVPKLGGQKGAYIEAALKAYRAGTRPHPTMQAQGGALTDQDIDDIVAWITAGGTAADDVTAEAIAGLEAAAQCINCHGPTGANMMPAPPVLSGQNQDYLRHALGQYKNQARGMTVMSAFAAGLSDDDIERITAFYSARNGLWTLSRDLLDKESQAPAR